MAVMTALTTRAKRLADMDQASSPIGTAEWEDYINEAEDFIYDILVASGLDYFVGTVQTISTDGVLQSFSLTVDFYETLYVLYKENKDNYIRLEPLNRFDLPSVLYTTGVRATRYRVADTKLVLYPLPPSGQTYEHHFAPRRATLATPDTSVIPDRWSEGTVIRTAMKARVKERRGIEDLLALWKEFEARLERHRRNRVLDALSVPETHHRAWDDDPFWRRAYRRVW